MANGRGHSRSIHLFRESRVQCRSAQSLVGLIAIFYVSSKQPRNIETLSSKDHKPSLKPIRTLTRSLSCPHGSTIPPLSHPPTIWCVPLPTTTLPKCSYPSPETRETRKLRVSRVEYVGTVMLHCPLQRDYRRKEITRLEWNTYDKAVKVASVGS